MQARILLLLLLTPMSAWAADQCKPMQTDLCQLARKMADETAPQLPMQLNKNLTLHSVFASGPSLALTAQLAYDKSLLDATLKQSTASDAQIKQALFNAATTSICNPASPTYNFISQGGSVQYIYRFNDGTTYTTINIADCTTPPKG